MRGFAPPPRRTLILVVLHPWPGIASSSSRGSEGHRGAGQAAESQQGGAEKVGAPGSAGLGLR